MRRQELQYGLVELGRARDALTQFGIHIGHRGCKSTSGPLEPTDSYYSGMSATPPDRTIGPMTIMDSIQDAMQRFHVPGAAVGVMREGSEEIRTFGVTSIDNPLPIEPDTLFQIGSITKTITATAIMRLVDQGELELEAPVRRYLPELRLADEDVAQRVTLRHLLTHTAGWVGDDFTDTGPGDDAVARYVANLADVPS
jgi:CubicO group peptidase (beta-lactamase class C family)